MAVGGARVLFRRPNDSWTMGSREGEGGDLRIEVEGELKVSLESSTDSPAVCSARVCGELLLRCGPSAETLLLSGSHSSGIRDALRTIDLVRIDGGALCHSAVREFPRRQTQTRASALRWPYVTGALAFLGAAAVLTLVWWSFRKRRKR